MLTEIRLRPAGSSDGKKIVELLHSEKLPTGDLSGDFSNFFVATKDDFLVGVIGLEKYGHYGLLRSLIVNPAYRNQNVAAKLILQLELAAEKMEINSLFLLTETAPQYFQRKGYTKISRSDVPELVQKCSEFSQVCPATAIVMKKDLA